MLSRLIDAMFQGIHCSAYNTSKAAVQQMSRSLAVEWGRFGVRVNTLSPGYIRTAMTDMLLAEKPELEDIWMAGALLGRLGAPEDFKAPAIYLLTDGSGFMTGSCCSMFHWKVPAVILRDNRNEISNAALAVVSVVITTQLLNMREKADIAVTIGADLRVDGGHCASA